MMKRNLFVGGGTVVLGLLLIALPSPTLNSQEPADRNIAQTEQRVSQASVTAAIEEAQEQQRRIEVRPEPGDEDGMVMLGDDGASWLGVESEEISAEKAKELKLPAERGVLLERVVPDSPAAKAGLKDNDVITEINGQRVEGAAQFHRMIHEIPAGRSAQFTVWRDGRAQTLSVTLGKSEERHNTWMGATPGTFAFRMPEVMEMPDM